MKKQSNRLSVGKRLPRMMPLICIKPNQLRSVYTSHESELHMNVHLYIRCTDIYAVKTTLRLLQKYTFTG